MKYLDNISNPYCVQMHYVNLMITKHIYGTIGNDLSQKLQHFLILYFYKSWSNNFSEKYDAHGLIAFCAHSRRLPSNMCIK